VILATIVAVACSDVIAQTFHTITQQAYQFIRSPQIPLGGIHFGIRCLYPSCHSIAINELTNKVYITNRVDGTVSIIDSNSGSDVKNIRVGLRPTSVASDDIYHRVYVLDGNSIIVINSDNDTVKGAMRIRESAKSIAIGNPGKIYVMSNNSISVIDGISGKEEEIALGFVPSSMAVEGAKIYVANYKNNSISVFSSDTKKRELRDTNVGLGPLRLAFNGLGTTLYVANFRQNTVSEFDPSNMLRISDFNSGSEPVGLAADRFGSNVYVLNRGDNTLSIINTKTHMLQTKVHVGEDPTRLAVNGDTKMIYVVNNNISTVSVIDGFTNNVSAGIKLNIHPLGFGIIMCGDKAYPTNIYLYVDWGTKCIAQPNNDSQFTGWVQNLGNNSTIPMGGASTLTVNRYGTFTANFKPAPPPIPTQYLAPLYGIIITSIIGWSIPNVIGWARARTQRKHTEECINQINKLEKNEIGKKIKKYYMEGKISESQYKLLKDEIAQHYESQKK